MNNDLPCPSWPRLIAVRSTNQFLSRSLFTVAALLFTLDLAHAQAPAFTNITDQAIAEALAWGGGQGRFLLQRKVNLSDPTWVNLLTTPAQGVTVPKDSQSSYFRLQSQTTNTVFAFGAYLNAASEVPTNASQGQGIGIFSLEGSNLTYVVSFSGLLANTTAGHIHAPANATNNAGVIIPFTVPAGKAGRISGSTVLTTDQVSNIFNGLAYANIHTTVNPGGEIRGQLVPLHVPITLTGAAETPAVIGGGSASGYLNFIGNQMFYSIKYSGLAGAATAAHIHGPAMPGVPANVLVPLATPSGTSGTLSGSVSLAPTNVIAVLAGQTYINIHTAANPNGEVRGQIWPVQWAVSMNGANEVPPTVSAGTGSGLMTFTNGVFNYSFSFTNLGASATAGHIHGPAGPTQNTNVLIPFTVPAGTSGSFSGSTSPNSLSLFWLLTGQTYANIHTTVNPGGEIRGQVGPNN